MSPARRSKPKSTPDRSTLNEPAGLQAGQTRPLFGSQVAQYHRNAFSRFGCGLTWLGFGVGAAILGFSAWQFLDNPTGFSQGSFILNNPLYWAGIFMLLLVIIGVLIQQGWRRPCLAIYQNGLTYRPGPVKTHQLLWSEIAGIAMSMDQAHFLWIHGSVHYSAIIYTKNGQSLSLDENLPQLPEALSHIKAGLYARLQPVLQADFDTGQWVSFGPLAIHQTSIGILKKSAGDLPPHQNLAQTIPWSILTKVQIEDGFLVLQYQVKARSRQRDFPVADIPNLEILLQLIQQVNIP